jgi:hypothetical protein
MKIVGSQAILDEVPRRGKVSAKEFAFKRAVMVKNVSDSAKRMPFSDRDHR